MLFGIFHLPQGHVRAATRKNEASSPDGTKKLSPRCFATSKPNFLKLLGNPWATADPPVTRGRFSQADPISRK